MTLDAYLRARRETEKSFALRSGVPQQTVNRIRKRLDDSRISALHNVVDASRREPAPCGGTVTYEDLLPQGEAEVVPEPARAARGGKVRRSRGAGASA